MTEIRDLVAAIREHEVGQSVARKANERSIPALKILLANIDSYGFGKEDLDLKQRMEEIAEKVRSLDTENITQVQLDQLRREASNVMEDLTVRYKGRMEAHASRQSSL